MAGLLTSGELASMVQCFTDSLDLTCTISRSAYGSDGLSGRAETWAADGTTTKLGIAAVKGHMGELIATRFGEGQIEYIATFTANSGNAVPKIRDRLAVSDGHSYEVVAVMDDGSSYNIADSFGLRKLS